MTTPSQTIEKHTSEDIQLAFRFADHKVHGVGREGGVFDLSIQEMNPETNEWGEVILAKANIEEFAALTALAIGIGEERHKPGQKDLTTDDLYVVAEKWFANNPNVPRFIP